MITLTIAGEPLQVELNYGAFRRIKAATGLDLLKPHEPIDDPGERPLQRLMEEPELILQCVEAIISGQGSVADRKQLQGWQDTFGGSDFGAAFEAIVTGWVDFFRQAGQPAKADMILNHLDVMTKAAEAYQETLATQNLGEALQTVVRDELTNVIQKATSKPRSGV